MAVRMFLLKDDREASLGPYSVAQVEHEQWCCEAAALTSGVAYAPRSCWVEPDMSGSNWHCLLELAYRRLAQACARRLPG